MWLIVYHFSLAISCKGWEKSNPGQGNEQTVSSKDIKRSILAYFRPVMLMNRKLTKDKRWVSDFRHINTRIAKINLSFPLVRDMFSMLGSSLGSILGCVQSRKYCEAIMDDLLLSRQIKKARLEELLKALLENGLKISPKSYQLFKRE